MSRPRALGCYVLFDSLASGGMGTVHLARRRGDAGFSRTVVVKRLHPHLATDPEFVAMLVDEARLASRVEHRNVIAPIDVLTHDERELLLVMDYVAGASLGDLLSLGLAPISVAVRIVLDLLAGLDAAHEAKDEAGHPLEIVHRDVSPQNVLVGLDGVTRVLDFGIAKARVRAQMTREGELKGKLSYMAPEQLRGRNVDRRSDVYAVGVVLWELVTGRRLREGATLERQIQALRTDPALPSSLRIDATPELDAVILRALATDPVSRFASAREMLAALEAAASSSAATATTVGDWVRSVAGDDLDARERLVEAVERAPLDGHEDLTSVTSGHGGALSVVGREDRAEVATERAIPRAGEGAATPSRPRRRVVFGVTVVVIATLAATLGFTRRGSVDAPPAPTVPPMPTPTPTPEPDDAPPSVTVATSAFPPPQGTPPSRAKGGAPRSTPAVVGRPPSSKASCDPPYTVDPNGIRRFKKDCVRGP